MRSRSLATPAPDPQNGAQTAAQAAARADTADAEDAPDREMDRRVRRLVAEDFVEERVRSLA
jgi:hypothetical protein